MILYTMGFTQKSAKKFFDILKQEGVEMLVDIRLNNKSQLAGFTKGEDLAYFLETICGCEYQHCVDFAPTKEILDDYKKGKITWDGYVEQFLPLMEKRNAVKRFMKFFSKYEKVCLLCSEPTPEQCHRRLLAELILEQNPEIRIIHV